MVLLSRMICLYGFLISLCLACRFTWFIPCSGRACIGCGLWRIQGRLIKLNVLYQFPLKVFSLLSSFPHC